MIGVDGDQPSANSALIDGVRRFAMDVRELDIDLIDRVNPFGEAYAILAKSMETMVRIMPPDAAALVTDQLREIVAQSGTQKGVRLLLAIVLAVFGAMRAASAIIMALNVAYEVRETRSFVRINLISVALTVGLVVVLIAGGIAISIKGSWSERMGGLPFVIEAILRMLVFGSAIGAVAATVERTDSCGRSTP